MNNTKPASSTAPIARYNFASSTSRFFSKILDIILIFLVIVAFAILLIFTDQARIEKSTEIILSQTWRYFLISFIACILSFLYLIVLPCFWNGQTLIKKLFKLSYYNLIPTKSFLLGLIKHDLFVWIITSTISFILSIVLFCLSPFNASILLKSMSLFKKPEEGITALFYTGTFFSTCFLISGFLTLSVVVHLFINNKKRNWIDRFSDVVVIKLVDVSSSDVNPKLNQSKNKKINYGLPGEIKESIIEEL